MGPYHARAMGNTLRDHRTPSDLAAIGQVIDFKEKISDFEHLAKIVEDDLAALDPAKMPLGWRESVVTGQIQFGESVAHEGLPVLDGRVMANVDAVCQRCLNALQVPLDVELKLLFSDSDKSDDRCGDYDVWELEGETLRPLDLIEEALIMALPLAAKHSESAVCKRLGVDEDGAQRTATPFEDLKARMAAKK